MVGPHDGRFAPSPTGALHIGNLRTALVAWLRARSLGGRFALRVDDLDPDRVRADHERAQIADLAALGIDWDGPIIHQRDRTARYDDAIAELVARELAYPCFCSRADIRAAASAPHGESADGAYPGTCAHLTPTTARARIDAGDAASIRVRVGSALRGFDDLVLGRVETVVDDFVIRRKDGVAAYNLASTLDEADLHVGEVVRGADLATSTPRQLWLADVLDVARPTFAHIPLMVAPDGERLAKRHGSVTLADLAAHGVNAHEALRLLLESLGEAVPDPAAPLARIVRDFDLTRLPTEDVMVNPAHWIAGTRPHTGTHRPHP